MGIRSLDSVPDFENGAFEDESFRREQTCWAKGTATGFAQAAHVFMDHIAGGAKIGWACRS